MSDYHPKIDISTELNSSDAKYFQSLAGILWRLVEIGRIDILVEVSMMSSMMALPRKGHIEQLFHIFTYLMKRSNSEMVFNPMVPDFDETLFPQEDWRYTPYFRSKEAIPSNIPKGRGLGFKVNANIDSDHTGNCITHRSRTGYIIFLDHSPIYWFSKKQGGIETSSFGSEFIVMK